jgi:hypothetical protein
MVATTREEIKRFAATPLDSKFARIVLCCVSWGVLVSCYISSGLAIQSVSIAAHVCG